MEETELIKIIVASVITGTVSTIATIKALRVHIEYIRESLTRHDRSIERAHNRIDELERKK